MSADDPRSSITFEVAAGSPSLPDVSQAGLLIGVGSALPASFGVYGSSERVRTVFGETMLTEIAENHFALDAARHPIAVVATAITTNGVLHLDVSGVNGSSAVTADEAVFPKGDWPGIQIDVVEGGTIGTPGILLDLSIDYGQTKTRVALGTATSVEYAEKGIKLDFGAGDLDTGDQITGWTEPPKWNTTQLQAAMAAATSSMALFSLVCIAEPLVPADGATISTWLNTLESSTPRRYAHVIGAKRRQYHATEEITITGTFANANPDTLTRSTGSFVTDGFKPGMRVTIGNANEAANEGTFVRVATVTATVLTFTPDVAFTAEASTAGVTVSGEETDDDYAYNIASEWAAYADVRVSLTNTPIRAVRPHDGMIPDQNTHGFLFSRCVAEPIQIEPGKRKVTPLGGGPVASKLSGRIKQGNTRILLDASNLAALATTPSRAIPLQTEADGSGPYFVEARTMFTPGGSDSIKFLRMARIVNEAKIVILAIEVQEILSEMASDPSDPTKLSAAAKADLEQAGRTALQKRLGAAISNARIEDPEGALFAVSDDTDLSTGIILIDIFLRTLFYPNGFKNRIAIKAPGF